MDFKFYLDVSACTPKTQEANSSDCMIAVQLCSSNEICHAWTKLKIVLAMVSPRKWSEMSDEVFGMQKDHLGSLVSFNYVRGGIHIVHI